MKILQKHFYQRDTVTVARELLGKKLVRIIDGQIMSGIIVETEAYCHTDDPASHAYRGKTKRNAPMFGVVGCAYIYFIYGNHFCFNIVAKEKGVSAGAVLIRAIAPVKGIELMQKHRKKNDVRILTNGPGKLAQALHIDKTHNFLDLTEKNQLFVLKQPLLKPAQLFKTPRIGISSGKEKLWRFMLIN